MTQTASPAWWLNTQTLEAAGSRALRGAFDLAQRELRRFSDEAQALSALLLVRAHGATRSVLVYPDNVAVERPSLSVWNAIRRRASPFIVDLLLGTVSSLHANKHPPEELRSRSLPGRPATHLLAFPLRAPGHPLCGVFALNVQTDEPTESLSAACAGWANRMQRLLDDSGAALLLLPRAAAPPSDFGLPCVSPITAQALQDLQSFAMMDDEPVLLRGESGTGKSTLAEWVHGQSGRAGPYMRPPIAGLPEQVQVAQLYGVKRGAYTDARENRAGYIEQARGGTLLIDEVDKLSMDSQRSLLGLLDTGEYARVGDTQPRPLEARLVFASNANLERLVEQGGFLGDLLHRINPLSVTVPPLRERPSELIPLAQQMLADLAERHKVSEITLDPDAQRLLQQAPWSGNLRELHGVLMASFARARAQAGAGGPTRICVEHVARQLSMEPAGPPLLGLLQRAAQSFVDEARARRGGPAPLTFAHTEAFRGLVLKEALAELPINDVFRLFGQDKAVRQNNQHKLARRQLDQAEELERLLTPLAT